MKYTIIRFERGPDNDPRSSREVPVGRVEISGADIKYFTDDPYLQEWLEDSLRGPITRTEYFSGDGLVGCQRDVAVRPTDPGFHRAVSKRLPPGYTFLEFLKPACVDEEPHQATA